MKQLGCLWVLLLEAGCHGPFQVQTDSLLRVPDGVSGKVQMQIPGQIDAGPMLEVPISSAHCENAKSNIAVIDIDGILCNLDYVGPYSQGENPVATFKE